MAQRTQTSQTSADFDMPGEKIRMTEKASEKRVGIWDPSDFSCLRRKDTDRSGKNQGYREWLIS